MAISHEVIAVWGFRAVISRNSELARLRIVPATVVTARRRQDFFCCTKDSYGSDTAKAWECTAGQTLA